MELDTQSQFIRTTWLLAASKRLDVANQSLSIRQISAEESAALREQARRRNVFARHSWENSFYLRRMEELEGKTVVDVRIRGELDDIMATARSRAEIAEKVTFISATLGLTRKRLHQLLAINQHRRSGFDIAISPGFRYLRTVRRQEPIPRGVPVDDIFVRRFTRCGFSSLIAAAGIDSDIGRRLDQGLSWIFESRQEISIRAAIVKTAIALESLLVASDVDSLRGPLAERAAFLLSDDPNRRRRIAKAVRTFYDLRSSIVHGGRRRALADPAETLEGLDRIVVLLLLTIATNAATWKTFDTLIGVVEEKKWGAAPRSGVTRPFPGSHLSRALQLCEPSPRQDG